MSVHQDQRQDITTLDAKDHTLHMTSPTQKLPPIEPGRSYVPSFWQRHKKKFLLALVFGLVLSAFGVVGLFAFYKYYVPERINRELKSRLLKVEERANVDIQTGTITPDGARGLKIESFTITPKGVDQPLVKVGQMEIVVDRAKLLAGEKVISGLTIKDVEVFIRRHQDGDTNIERILAHMRKGKKPGKKTVKLPTGKRGVLRYFGGEVPNVEVTNTVVHFITEDATKPFPLQKLELPSSILNKEQVKSSVIVHAKPNPTLSLPKTMTIDGSIASPLKQSTVNVAFDKPLRISGLPPYPFMEIGLSNLAISPGAVLKLDDLTVRTTFQKESASPLLSTKTISIQLANVPTSLSTLNVEALKIIKPEVHVRFNEIGASNVHDLRHAIQAPAAAHILSRARQVSKRIVRKQQKQAQKNAPDKEINTPANPQPTTSPKPSIATRIKDKLTSKRLRQLIPNQITIEQASLRVDDARNLPVVRPTNLLRVADASFKVIHDGQKGRLQAEGKFKAEAAGGQERGSAQFELKLDYQAMGIEANLKTKMLDLSWVAQLVGPKLSSKLRGGQLDVALKIDQDRKGAPVHFSGLFDVKYGYLVWEKLAEQPIEGWQARYDFAGHFDRNAPIPAAKLIKTALDANVPKDDQAQTKRSKRRLLITPPTKGELVFTRGKASFGKVSASVLPAFYGLDINKPLPARFDLSITMPQLPVQHALESIPAALLGELVQAKLRGFVSLDFNLEVPMYDASEMIWRGEPKFKDVSIQRLPNSMDVRKLVRGFRHTIEDDRVNFKRRIRVDEMSLIPAQWLMDNAGLSLADVDEHWRRGGWFEDVDNDMDASQNYWMSRKAAGLAASKPWGEDTSGIVRRWRHPSRSKKRAMSESPYGPYVYVPLHHISPWLVRAILTTEDNSFFRHDGFNRHALKQSIERNIAAGDYVRGASTISMQLVKNIFLTRKKVMARKLQEAILVYLMESVVQVPKGRLMELYLNVIEFAPGVFGIHDAAVHYFGKRPSDLTLAECAWLVTIVPGPKRYHYHWSRGSISDGYWNRIKRYIKIIRNRERATEEEYQAAIAEKPSFYKPNTPDAPPLRTSVVEAPLPTEQLTPEDIQKLLPPM